MKITSTYTAIFIIFLMGCASEKTLHPTYNKGRYEYKLFSKEDLKEQNMISVSGRIESLEKGEFLGASSVEIGCIKKVADDGRFYFRLEELDIASQIKVVSIGFLNMETQPIKLSAGDSLVVNFFMDEDRRLLINCEGSKL